MAVGFISTWGVVGDMPKKRVYHTAMPRHWEEMKSNIEGFLYLKRASEKGYPKLMDRGMYFVMLHDMDCHNHPIGYTTATEFAEGVFLVGNTWVDDEFRGLGYHTELLRWRNEQLKETYGATHIYTCVNAQEGIPLERLENTISKLGYRKVSIGQMIMDGMRFRDAFNVWRCGLPVWRLDFDC